jgi:hypothetical protein
MPQQASPDNSLRRRWVETWRRAGEELERLRRAEIESIDTREAIRQIFGSHGGTHGGSHGPALPAPSTTSGLIEQQAWFARIQKARRE